MTTPEDRVVWESDEDALYRNAHALPATLPASQPDGGSQDAGDATGARRDRYVEAIHACYDTDTEVSELEWDDRVARAVLAVADEELAGRDATIAGLRDEVEVADHGVHQWQQSYLSAVEHARELQASAAAAEAEVERLREDASEYDGILTRQGDLLTRTVNVLKGDPPPLTSWSHHDIPELAQEVVALLAKVKALAAEHDHCSGCPTPWWLRTLLDPSPAATTGEGMGSWFRETPESLAMLAEETKALQEAEDRAATTGEAVCDPNDDAHQALWNEACFIIDSASCHDPDWDDIEGQEHRSDDSARIGNALLNAGFLHRQPAPVSSGGAGADGRGIAGMARDFSLWLNSTYPPNLDTEALHWRRVRKVSEEAGEVEEALAAWVHENPRKPAGPVEDVIKELADCVGAALGAIEHLTGHEGRSLDIATQRVMLICDRVGIGRFADSDNGGGGQ